MTPAPRSITATYRLQLTRDFPLSRARELVPYFDDLGVSHLYCSPLLAARSGSTHGYDVIDPTRLNPELGGEDDLRGLVADLRARNMGIVLDIVPNHMAATDENKFWDDVLERGRASRFASWFDVDWDAPDANDKVVLPVLGDELDRVLERDELKLHIRDSGARIAYFNRTFPLDPSTLPKELQLAQFDPAGRPAADEWAAGDAGRARLRALLDAQHFRLVQWRRTPSEINYRRFFDVNDLVALKMEDEVVFDATHKTVLSWVREGLIDGLRIDHVDGLREPSRYLTTLRSAVDAAAPAGSERIAILVEKILLGDETLPAEWPVEGTTGYDFLVDIEELFVDPDGYTAIEANYRGLRHNPSLTFRAVVEDGKRRVLTGPLNADVHRAARIACGWSQDATVVDVAAAIVEFVIGLGVYRTYVSEPGVVRAEDRRVLEETFTRIRARGGVNDAAIALLERAFFAPPAASDAARRDFVLRLQQIGGPAAAKGVEDTALYVFVPLLSRNEVGGSPERSLGHAHRRVHERNAARGRDWPATLLATNTHDTKRSADVRSRIDAISRVPQEWARYVARWRKLNKGRKRVVRGKPTPETNAEYMFYQTLVGVWPGQSADRRADDLPDKAWREDVRERLVAFMLKAAREAKTRTSWTEGDTQYEKALEAFVRDTLEPHEDAPFMSDVARFVALIARDGYQSALCRIVLHCTAPGIPDIYRGDELWNFTLVDPDNRIPVDYDARVRMLNELAKTPNALRDAFGDDAHVREDRMKMALTTTLLRFRRNNPQLFKAGDYTAVAPGQPSVFAFARTTSDAACLTIIRTGVADSTEPIELPDELAGQWTSILTGRRVELVRVTGKVFHPVSELVPPPQPCDVLARMKS